MEIFLQEKSKGWLCPQCNKAHGPHVDTCPSGDGGTFFPTPVIVPTIWPSPTTIPYPTTAPWSPPFITTCQASVLPKQYSNVQIWN